jgi:hypothetical protein
MNSFAAASPYEWPQAGGDDRRKIFRRAHIRRPFYRQQEAGPGVASPPGPLFSLLPREVCGVLTGADFERCAVLMVELHGDNASARAHLRAAELRELGEQDAAEIWMQVKATIERLQAKSPTLPIERQLTAARP